MKYITVEDSERYNGGQQEDLHAEQLLRVQSLNTVLLCLMVIGWFI